LLAFVFTSLDGVTHKMIANASANPAGSMNGGAAPIRANKAVMNAGSSRPKPARHTFRAANCARVMSTIARSAALTPTCPSMNRATGSGNQPHRSGAAVTGIAVIEAGAAVSCANAADSCGGAGRNATTPSTIPTAISMPPNVINASGVMRPAPA